MNSTPEDLVKALRRSLKQNERLKRENRDLLARTTEPVAVVGIGGFRYCQSRQVGHVAHNGM